MYNIKVCKYTKQAEDFLINNNAFITVKFLRHAPYFMDDKDSRDIYEITLERKGLIMVFTFGSSITKSAPPPNPFEGQKKRTRPTAYDVLACLTKYEPSADVWEFAAEYGYTIDSREAHNKIEAICIAVNKEYRDVMRLFGDVIDELAEIN